MSSLLIKFVNDHEDDPHCLALTNRCRIVCLQAGADPTLYHDDEQGLMYSALHAATTVSLEL